MSWKSSRELQGASLDVPLKPGALVARQVGGLSPLCYKHYLHRTFGSTTGEFKGNSRSP